MAAIDVGSAAINRNDVMSGGNYTVVPIDNPANFTGKITQVQIWANTNLAGVEVAIFSASGNNLTTRSAATIGNVTAGSAQSFAVSLDVKAGDYIGMWWASGDMELSTNAGTGFWYCAGDNIPCTNQTFTLGVFTRTLSLYGTGATLGGPKSNPALIAIGRGLI